MTYVALSTLVSLRRGASYKSALLGSDGVPLLGLGTIRKHGGFKAENLRYYSGEAPSRMLISAGDLYVSLKDMTHEAALLGAVAMVPANIASARLTQDTIALDLIARDRIDPTYLYWQLQTPKYRAYCRSHGTGTTNLDLSQESFLDYEIPIPSLQEQLRQVSVLGALDDKIKVNQRVVDSADTLRTALWQRLTDGAPKVPLSSIARFVNGKAFTKDATGTGKIVIRIAELNSGIGTSTIYNDIEVADDHLARPGDLLMAWSGSLTTARWYRDDAIINQHIFKVIPCGTNPLWTVACALETKMAEFRMIAAAKATTMGHIQRYHLDEPVHWPELTEAQRNLGERLWTRALFAEKESENLVATRNELLPLLMDGKITLNDVDARAEQEA